MSTHAVSALSGRTFDAVLFDMDGTLVDSTAAVERSWRQWGDEHAVDPFARGAFHGVPARAVVAGLLPEDSWDAATDRMEAIEIADTTGVALLPGTAELLASLEGTGARTALVTSCSALLYAARARAVGLPELAVVVTASDVEHGKPAPDPYLLAASRLGVDPARCLVVEDAESGLRSARAAGCATLAVVSTTPRAELEAGGLADAVVDSLTEVRFVVTDGMVALTARG